jgi:hypothetical protein
MKTLFRLIAFAATAFLLQMLATFVMMSFHLGPFWRAGKLLVSPAMERYDEATTTAFFQAASQAATLERYVVWPLSLAVASVLAARFARPSRPWHPLVISAAVLPISIPPVRLPIPGYSIWHGWADIALEYLAYALLVGVFLFVAGKVPFRRSEENAVA